MLKTFALAAALAVVMPAAMTVAEQPAPSPDTLRLAVGAYPGARADLAGAKTISANRPHPTRRSHFRFGFGGWAFGSLIAACVVAVSSRAASADLAPSPEGIFRRCWLENQ